MSKHLLTILVEDYFQVGAFGDLIQEKSWTRFETRYEINTRRVLDLLDTLDTKATFFVLGWVAERSPELVREIVSRGHEVASRGFYHRPLRYLSPEEFRQDLIKTNKALENACGQRIKGYRAAEKLNYERDKWIFEILAEEGFEYDASFLPRKKTQERYAHKVRTSNGEIWEFPYPTKDLKVGLLPIAGGNYFRQIPYTFMRIFVNQWIQESNSPFIFYFHVWELDKNQPRISAATFLNKIRHYRKLDKMEWIINETLRKHEFCSIAEYLGINAESKILETRTDRPIEQIHLTSNFQIPITIVVPCYNEAEVLGFLAKTLAELETDLEKEGYQAHFIFVDDASTDKTYEKLLELFFNKPRVKILRHEKNLGVAAGIMTGLRVAETEIVCSIDCDCSYDPHNLIKMIPLLTEDVDLVTASPYHPHGMVRNVPKWRLFLSKVASKLYQRLLNSEVTTYTSCFRVYRKKRVSNISLTHTDFLGIAEMMGKILIGGGKVIEWPATLEVRLFGFSKMKTMKTILGHLRLMFSLTYLRFFGKAMSIQTFPSMKTFKSERKNEGGNR